MNWERGRQGTGYLKKRLFLWHLWFRNTLLDCYILKYPTGTYIPLHTDDLGFWTTHWRLNILLWKAKKGGKFFTWQWDKPLHERSKVWKMPRAVLFRSDKVPHAVTNVEEGERWVLSIGVAYT